MTDNKAIGVVLGLAICALVIAGNIRRTDPHLVSVYPDLAGMTIAPIAIYILGRRRRLRGDSPEAVVAFGLRAGAIAGGVFAAGLWLFTLYRSAAWPLWMLASGTAFGSVFVLCSFAAYAAGHKRIIAI